jgi:predicted DsbA family dithiol-disulfide isomerase
LLDLVAEAGLDRQQAERLLAGDGGAREVRAGEAQAHTLGVQGVPFFVANRRLALSGAQEPGVFLDAFNELVAADQPVSETGTCRRDPASGEPPC